MNQFYDIDNRNVSHREYWWGNPSPLVLIGWLIKWLRIRLPGSSDNPNTESTLPFVLDQLPVEIQEAFAPLARELAEFGFSDPVYHQIHDPGTTTTIYWATYRHETGSCFARIHHRIWQQASKPARGLFPMFFTEFVEGTFLVSSSGKPDMTTPATVRMNRMPKAPAAVLWEAHCNLLAQPDAQKGIVPIQTPEDLIAATERHHVLVRDFHLARGVFRPRGAAEQAQAEAYSASVAEAHASGLQDPEVHAELQKLQVDKPNWKPTLWILLASVLLFGLIGKAQWDWQFTLWLIPIMFIHETGHWLAMRIFKYRNLRMFFIPMFGAAVIGRHWNVPGWKKALVSLAGPLPGVAIGAVLTAAALLTRKPWMNEAALIFLLLNGFNLLPILPMDGGHVFQATLFCRNRWLDFVFRIGAVAGLFALSVMGFGKGLLFLTIFMAISLPTTLKLGKVIEDLRKTPLPPPIPGEDRIPPTTAQAVISAVKAALPKATSNKVLAQHSLNVIETLNARPPGVLATLGLLALHLAAVFVAVLCGFLLILGRQGSLGDIFQAAARRPQYALDCGDARSVQGAQAATTPGSKTLLFVTCERREAALAGFEGLTKELPDTSRLNLIGNSLFLQINAGDEAMREQWFERLQSLSTNVYVSVSNRTAQISLTCVAPTGPEATNLIHELQAYFEVGGGTYLIPPWSPQAQEPGFKKYLEARASWRQINEALNEIRDDPRLEKIVSKMLIANRRGATAEAKRLAEERETLTQELRTQALDQLRSNPTNHYDPELLELNARLASLHPTNRLERTKLMSQVAVKLGSEAATEKTADFYCANLGMVLQHGLLLEMSWVSFNDASTGLPAFVNWLCQKQCVSIHYDVGPGYGGSLDEAEHDTA